MVLAVFRFTFGRPKVNRGVRGRVAPETSLAPEGETPLSPGYGGALPPIPLGVGAGSPHRVETRNNSLSPAEPARQEFKKEEQFLWQK